MVPIPSNLGLLIGQVSGDQAGSLEKVLKGDCPLAEVLDALGRHWKIKVVFNQEHDFQVLRHIIKEGDTRWWKHSERSTVHIFPYICLHGGLLLYKTTRNARHGYHFPSLDSVVSYEPVIRTTPRVDEFRGLEHFASKFDRRFITESEIQKLWAGTSAQHGGKYKPSDFHRLGRQGKQVLDQFLRLFIDVNTEGKGYMVRHLVVGADDQHKSLDSYYRSSHQLGRDIQITHTLGQGKVFYSSEYHGCSNGRYGLLANKNEFLWLEDD